MIQNIVSTRWAFFEKNKNFPTKISFNEVSYRHLKIWFRVRGFDFEKYRPMLNMDVVINENQNQPFVVE